MLRTMRTTNEIDDALPAVAERVAAVPGASGLLTRWTLIDDDALEIFRQGCSKASALAHLAAAHGIGMDEVMAIGDGLNDCEILAAVGLGVAMGNACPEARAAARVQVGSNEQDGVAEAIERFVLRA
jgi:hydroxymethylpyrimidine pyrophosphatase-like HAD family hydrolase